MKLVFFLSFMIISNSYLFAQNDSNAVNQINMSLFVGASFPNGDFGSTGTQQAGFANTGICGIIESAKTLSDDLNWPVTIMFSLNSIDDVELEKQIGNDIDVGANPYFTSWVMTGISYTAPASSDINVYGMGQLGVLVSVFPDIIFSQNGNSITQTTSTGIASAYSFGAGMEIGDINFGFRYFAAKPRYTQRVVTGSGAFSETITLPVSALLILIGFRV